MPLWCIEAIDANACARLPPYYCLCPLRQGVRLDQLAKVSVRTRLSLSKPALSRQGTARRRQAEPVPGIGGILRNSFLSASRLERKGCGPAVAARQYGRAQAGVGLNRGCAEPGTLRGGSHQCAIATLMLPLRPRSRRVVTTRRQGALSPRLRSLTRTARRRGCNGARRDTETAA